MTNALIKFELQCSPAIANAIKNSPNLPLNIHDHSEVQRDFGSLLESIAASIAANYATRLIDTIIAATDKHRDPDQHQDDNSAIPENTDDDANAEQPAAFFIFAGDTFDLTIPLDRADCIEAVQAAADDKPKTEI